MRSASRAASGAGREPLGERLARHQLQDEEARVAGFLEAVDRGDVRVVERREELRFAVEARQPLRVGGEGLGQDLERDVAAELRVARPVDLTHAPRADEATTLNDPSEQPTSDAGVAAAAGNFPSRYAAPCSVVSPSHPPSDGRTAINESISPRSSASPEHASSRKASLRSSSSSSAPWYSSSIRRQRSGFIELVPPLVEIAGGIVGS